MQLLFTLLGWDVVKEGDKCLPFAEVFSPLGINLEMQNMHLDHSFTLSNKESRIRDLIALSQQAIFKNCLLPAEASSCVGKFRFAVGQCLSRGLAPALSILSRRANGPWTSQVRNTEVELALRHIIDFFQDSSPRKISLGDEKRPILVFTDGSSEGTFHGIGAVVIDVASNYRGVWEAVVPTELIQAWTKVVGSQLIGQIELFPIVAIRILLAALMSNRRTIFFIDNDSARDGLIKAYSPSVSSMALISKFFEQETACPCYPWFARVPSFSNPGDMPSRGQGVLAASKYGAKYEGQLTMCSDVVTSLVSAHSYESLLRTI
jgi:hypothetical protein